MTASLDGLDKHSREMFLRRYVGGAIRRGESLFYRGASTSASLERYNAIATSKLMDVQAYLERIEYQGSLTCDHETLRQLHLSHLLHVPFENLSIHAHEPIVLNDVALFEKVVTRRRGGFCYELNGLFAALLRELGFEVSMLSAQVASDQGEFSPDFDHMTLMVGIKQARWLADVGFGDSFIEPLALETERENRQRESTYRIVC